MTPEFAAGFNAGLDAAMKVAEDKWRNLKSDDDYTVAYQNAGKSITTAISALKVPSDLVAVPRDGQYTHRKGGVYDSFGKAVVQTDVPLVDMDEVVVYRSQKDGTLWVRRAAEFEDGRFTRAMIAATEERG